MDNFHLLGSITSIISLVISLGIIFSSVIKKRKISFFNLYMLTIVLIQAISVGWWLWNGKNLIAVTVGMFFIFTILFWIVMHLTERQLDIFKSQIETIKFQEKINESQRKINKSQMETITEINQDMVQFSNLFREFMEVITELMRVESIKIDTKTERLEDELKKLEKKIRKKKSTK